MVKPVLALITEYTLNDIIVKDDCFNLTLRFDNDQNVVGVDLERVDWFECGDADSGPKLGARYVKIEACFDGNNDEIVRAVFEGREIANHAAADLVDRYVSYAKHLNIIANYQ